MIRNVCECPYCGAVAAAVDDDGPTLIVAPDRADGRPCPHAAFVIATLSPYFAHSGRPCEERTWDWMWVRGTGTVVQPPQRDPLFYYVGDVGWESLADEELPSVEYQLAQATALDREMDRPGSGEFEFSSGGGPAVKVMFDGVGVFSPTPEALVAEMRRRAGSDEEPRFGFMDSRPS